jgi:WD40 repeat protein
MKYAIYRKRKVVSLIAWLVFYALFGCGHTPGRDRALQPVMATAFSVDNETLAVSTNTSEVALFDVEPLRLRLLLTSKDAKIRPPGYTKSYRSPPVAFSPNGTLLVSADESGEIVGWETQSGSIRFRSLIEKDFVDIAFFPDGQSFVTVGPGAKLWSAVNGSVLGEFRLPRGTTATSVDISSDGKIVLVGLSSGEIAEFDGTNRIFLRTLKGHLAPVTGIAFSPDGLAIATTAGRFDPRIWKLKKKFPSSHKPTAVDVFDDSLDKKRRATWVVITFFEIASWIISDPPGPAFSSSSFDLEKAARESSLYCSPRVAYSPNGRFLAVTTDLSKSYGDFHLMLLDLVRKEVRIISDIYGCSVAFTKDSKFVVTGGLGAPVFWNAETGATVRDKARE